MTRKPHVNFKIWFKFHSNVNVLLRLSQNAKYETNHLLKPRLSPRMTIERRQVITTMAKNLSMWHVPNRTGQCCVLSWSINPEAYCSTSQWHFMFTLVLCLFRPVKCIPWCCLNVNVTHSAYLGPPVEIVNNPLILS